jgi:hypothetical protein
MNDALIRKSFHRKKLCKYHKSSKALVIDELGLKHGMCRADIAVINGHLIAYEIKSDEDSLRRITKQVNAYNAVFDRATVIVGQRHLKNIEKHIPNWWGIIAASTGQYGAVHFKTERPASWNQSTDNYSVAQLLWKKEVEEELAKRGLQGRFLRQKRSVLYKTLLEAIDSRELRKVVMNRLKNRTDWRYPAQPFLHDG